MENCFSSPSAFKRWFVFHMDTCAGLQLWLNYRCAIWKAPGGGGLDMSRCFFVVAYQKPTHKEGIFASHVWQIPACIIWSQTNPTKPTHSMLLTAHFTLIYILKRPPTHDQYLLALKDDPTVLIKSTPVQTQLFSFSTEQHLKICLVNDITAFITGKPFHFFPPQTLFNQQLGNTQAPCRQTMFLWTLFFR